jgi:hypothetical protein
VPTADVGDAEFAEGGTEPLAALLDVAAPVVFAGSPGTAESAKGEAEPPATLSEVIARAADTAPLVFAGCIGAAESMAVPSVAGERVAAVVPDGASDAIELAVAPLPVAGVAEADASMA